MKFTSAFNIKPETFSKLFFRCPECKQGEFQYGHLLSDHEGRKAGPWGCDECGAHWRITIENGEPMLCPDERRTIFYHSVLELPGTSLRLVVHSFTGGKSIGEDGHYWEEWTCPTNFLGSACEVEFDGEIDPHGAFRVVATFETEDEAKQYLEDNPFSPERQAQNDE